MLFDSLLLAFGGENTDVKGPAWYHVASLCPGKYRGLLGASPWASCNGKARPVFHLLSRDSVTTPYKRKLCSDSLRLLVLCHQPLWEVDLNMTHPALTEKGTDGQSDSHFEEPKGCSLPHDIFQVFIPMKIFLSCQTENRSQVRATKLIHFH